MTVSIVALSLFWQAIAAGTEIGILVTDEQRRPVKRAAVWVVPCDKHGAFLASPKPFQTDTKGRVRLDPISLMGGLWEATHLRLWAVKGNRQSHPQIWAKPLLGFESGISLLHLSLKPTVLKPLQVQITDARKRPIAKAKVFLWRIFGPSRLSPLIGTWTTDAAGWVKTGFHLPVILERLAKLCNSPLRFFVLAYHPKAGWAWIDTDLAGLSRVRLSLVPPLQTVLTVQDCFGELRQDLMGRLAAIKIPHDPPFIPLPATEPFLFCTDARGKIVLPIPKDGQGLWEWSRRAPYGLQTKAKSLWLTAGTSQMFSFHWRTIRVIGRLLDVKTGKPLEGEMVTLIVHLPPLEAAMPVHSWCVRTDAQGRFIAQTPPHPQPRYLRLDLILPDGLGFTLWERPFKGTPSIVSCQRWDIGDLNVEPPTATLTGRVVNQGGKPAPFALVDGWRERPLSETSPRTMKCKARGEDCAGARWEFDREIRERSKWLFAFAFADQKGRFKMALREGVWKIKALRVGPPHRPPMPVPTGALILRYWTTGPLPSSTHPKGETRLKVSERATVQVTLPLSGWTYVKWFLP